MRFYPLCLLLALAALSACSPQPPMNPPKIRNDQIGRHVFAEPFVPPYGQAVLVMELKPTDDQDAALKDVRAMLESWPTHWPRYKKKIERMLKDYDKPNTMKDRRILVSVVRLTPEVYMGDKAKFLLSFTIDDSGASWDIFIDADKIVHSQPVL